MEVEKIISKLNNREKLTEEEIDYMVSSYNLGEICDDEMGRFLLLVKEHGLSYEETFYMTKSMINSGEILDLKGINKIINNIPILFIVPIL